jgi:hypothetical protein
MRGHWESPACFLETGSKYVPGMDRREPVRARDPKKADEELRIGSRNGIDSRLIVC